MRVAVNNVLKHLDTECAATRVASRFISVALALAVGLVGAGLLVRAEGRGAAVIAGPRQVVGFAVVFAAGVVIVASSSVGLSLSLGRRRWCEGRRRWCRIGRISGRGCCRRSRQRGHAVVVPVGMVGIRMLIIGRRVGIRLGRHVRVQRWDGLGGGADAGGGGRICWT